MESSKFKIVKSENRRIILLFWFFLVSSILIVAQPRQKLVQVIVSPDKDDWTYDVGDQAEFKITVLKNNIPLSNINVNYRVNPEMMNSWDEGMLNLKNGEAFVKTKKKSEAGFLQCHASVVVDGQTYSGYATAGFSPSEIKPTTDLPSDFEEFWDNAKSELAKTPIKPVLTLMPESCTDKVNVYHVSINNIQGKIYGVLCEPKVKGKYPAILQVPGAGVRPYYGDVSNAEKGIITFQIGIHGIPVNLNTEVYEDLKVGALNGYMYNKLDDKDRYYYKRVYLGCIRALDFIETLDNFDGRSIAVTGNSQGGALSIVTAALDDRIDCLAAVYPALSDLTGYIHGRAGGWPHLFREGDVFTNKLDKIETSKYYDVVNFARFVKVPGWYTWGYNDNIVPPTSMYAAFNVISAPKELHVFQETQHWFFPEQQKMRNLWLYDRLYNK